jgi:hypothetical protein
MPGEAHSFGHNLTATDSVIGCVVRAQLEFPSACWGAAITMISRIRRRSSSAVDP